MNFLFPFAFVGRFGFHAQALPGGQEDLSA